MAPPAHTDQAKQLEVEKLIGQFLNREIVREAAILDPDRVETFLQEYRQDKNAASLVRKDALLNHLLCLHILHSQFVD